MNLLCTSHKNMMMIMITPVIVYEPGSFAPLAGIFANDPWLMFGQNARMIYIGTALLSIVSILFLLSLLNKQNRINRVLRNGEEIRSDLYAKIIHEFRTPITIILGLNKQLREKKNLSSNHSMTYLNAIERQGRALSDLVNQLMDIANLHSMDHSVEWKTGNIVAFVEMIHEEYSIYAMQQEIELQFFSNEKEIETDFVPSYLNKILRNLLSNAIKFSEPGSRIDLVLTQSKIKPNRITIEVIDQGAGIKKEDLSHIFELFYKSAQNDTYVGNGVGLTLTKQLVEYLNGTISVKSEKGKGSRFIVELPVHRNEKKLYTHWIREKVNQRQSKESTKVHTINELSSLRTNENDPRTTILLAEDNKDIAIYTRSILNEERYNMIFCHNGEEAIKMTNEHMPDIVITDVIMPRMSGLNLCKEIKNSPLLSHIPIIIISAKNEEDDLIEGLKCGADSYIRKPFQPEELLLKVENILKSRNLIKEKYQRAILQEEKNVFHENVNMDFLRHTTDIIYREMRNQDFNSRMLAKELAISNSQLNKKLNATTGFPASTYILQVKLAFAKKILASQNKSVGEVAAECGIYDVNYFSRVFKKHTGVTPSQYKRITPLNGSNALPAKIDK